MNKIEKLAEERGCTYWQAKYIIDRQSRFSSEYTPRPRRGWTPKQFDQYGIKVRYSPTSLDWVVTQNGKVRPQFICKGTVYKDGGCKYYPAVTVTIEGKQKLLSLALCIMVGALHKEVPAGYVVDHIDNDSFNNNVNNLQILTIRQNIEKNPSKLMKEAHK